MPPPDHRPPDHGPPDHRPPDHGPASPPAPDSADASRHAAAERDAAAVFTALADPTRRSILSALAQRGPATATELAGQLPISRQAIAKHLSLLAEAGLVRPQPGERRRVRFALQSAPMATAQAFLAALARDWDGHLDALRRHLDAAPGNAAHGPAGPADAQPDG
ncbi:MAG TPA: winged helix-turn-helix domain-containing protein [Streptosporangiaceae bacterium]|nr:winged helix-turn-helix domain-containing protein [Streptosporangiaceae bacterium]